MQPPQPTVAASITYGCRRAARRHRRERPVTSSREDQDPRRAVRQHGHTPPPAPPGPTLPHPTPPYPISHGGGGWRRRLAYWMPSHRLGRTAHLYPPLPTSASKYRVPPIVRYTHHGYIYICIHTYIYIYIYHPGACRHSLRQAPHQLLRGHHLASCWRSS